jgi:hypothetical protein
MWIKPTIRTTVALQTGIFAGDLHIAATPSALAIVLVNIGKFGEPCGWKSMSPINR